MEETHFSKKYLIVNEVSDAVTHGVSAGLSTTGLAILLAKGARSDSSVYVVSHTIYGFMLILLFLSSMLSHSLVFTRAKKVFQVFDHNSIFLLIAGSYTPFCLTSVGGWLGWALFSLVWLIAIVGIAYKSFALHKQETVENIPVIIHTVLDWFCIIATHPLYESLGLIGTALLVAGDVSYASGAVFYSLKNVRFMHVAWHLFVILAATLMYFSVLLYTWS